MSSDNKKLIPILVIIGVLMCGCIAVPVLGGIAMIGWLGMRVHDAPHMAEDAAPMHRIDLPMPADLTGIKGVPTDFGGGQASGSKQAAQQEMLAAEVDLRFAQANYEAAQAVYEQQRNFNNSQAGRLGAQGINLPPPMQPDPSLYQAVLAAQQRYDAAKAAYEAIP